MPELDCGAAGRLTAPLLNWLAKGNCVIGAAITAHSECCTDFLPASLHDHGPKCHSHSLGLFPPHARYWKPPI